MAYTVSVWSNSKGKESYPDQDGRPIKMQRQHRRHRFTEEDKGIRDWTEYRWNITHTGCLYQITGPNCTQEANALAWRIQNNEPAEEEE